MWEFFFQNLLVWIAPRHHLSSLLITRQPIHSCSAEAIFPTVNITVQQFWANELNFSVLFICKNKSKGFYMDIKKGL